MIAHGGAVGEGLYWASTTLFQRLGAHILVLLMLVSGVLLLTGTTLATALGRTGRALRKAGTGTREVARTVRAQRAPVAEPVGGGARRRDHDQPRARDRDVRDRAPGGRARRRRGRHDRGPRGRRGRLGARGRRSRRPPTSRPHPSRRARSRPSRRRRRWAGAARATASPSREEVAYRLPPVKALDRGRADPAPTCATARRPRRRCSSRCATSGSRRGCWGRSAART